MDDFGAIVAIVFWIAIAVLSKMASAAKKRRQAQGGGASAPRPAPGGGLQSLLQQMAKEAGLYQEPPVASEHVPAAGEHRGTAGEHRRTASESRMTALEHHQAESERRRTAGEARATAGEHRGSAGEHRRGDVVVLPPIPAAGPRVRRRSSLAAGVFSDLHGRRRGLARAIVLREILGPPVGLD